MNDAAALVTLLQEVDAALFLGKLNNRRPHIVVEVGVLPLARGQTRRVAALEHFFDLGRRHRGATVAHALKDGRVHAVCNGLVLALLLNLDSCAHNQCDYHGEPDQLKHVIVDSHFDRAAQRVHWLINIDY